MWSAEFGCQIGREKLKERQVNHSNVPSERIGYVGEGTPVFNTFCFTLRVTTQGDPFKGKVLFAAQEIRV